MNGCLPLAGVFAEEMLTGPCQPDQSSVTGRQGQSPPAKVHAQLCPPTWKPCAQPRLYDGDMLEIFTSGGRRLVGSPDVVVSLVGGQSRRLGELWPERDRVITCGGPEDILCKIGHRYRGTAYALMTEPRPRSRPASPASAWISGLLVGSKASAPKEGTGGGP